MTVEQLNEPVLDADYPVYAGYMYVVDGQPQESDVSGTVRDLRRATGATEVRRCDIVRRKL